ncbi:hypothetical protein TNCV_463901 [Trichonephila clavipes]|nr:hypothetical protein TNCV_463901 [Trichonephila clavipes]
MKKKDRYLKSFPSQKEAGGRERPYEDETEVTSRGREAKSAGRKGLRAPKRVRGAPKTQWEGECCYFFLCSRNEKKRVCKERLRDATAGGTKLEPALTLIPVLM